MSQPISLRVPCPKCGQQPIVAPVLFGDELGRALENDGEVEVACFFCDFRWNLNEQDKANLRKNRKAATA
jgi:redox-regulated HSP33 family molecular chaperone